MTEQTVARRYTEEDIETGLQAVAMYAGKTTAASEALEEQGIRIPSSTLGNWTKSHAKRYHEIRDQRVPELRARLAEQYEDAANEALTVARYAAQKAFDQLKSGQNRNPADAAAKLTTAASLMTDRANLLRGQATHRIELANATDILSELANKLPNAGIIDSTATEIA